MYTLYKGILCKYLKYRVQCWSSRDERHSDSTEVCNDWTGSPHKRQEIEQAGADVLSIGRTITTDVKGSELH